MRRHQPEADEAAPVLADEGEPVEAEVVEEERARPGGVACVGVVAPARAGCDEDRCHVAAEEAPRTSHRA